MKHKLLAITIALSALGFSVYAADTPTKPAATDAKPATDKPAAKPEEKATETPKPAATDAKPATDKPAAKPEEKAADKPLKQAATPSFTGKWKNQDGEMKLTQQGNKVTGTYSPNEGRVEGTVSGNTLSGKWSEKGGKETGDFELVLSSDGKTFMGKWRNEGKDKWEDDPWNGELVSE